MIEALYPDVARTRGTGPLPEGCVASTWEGNLEDSREILLAAFDDDLPPVAQGGALLATCASHAQSLEIGSLGVQ